MIRVYIDELSSELVGAPWNSHDAPCAIVVPTLNVAAG
jgi:hypothetical protein